MKHIFTLSILFSFLHCFAQDVTTKIPKEALIVATVKGDNLQQLMSLDEINKSYIGQELLKDLSNKQDRQLTSLEEMGFNLEASSHYFYEANDSIAYNVFLIPIKDLSKFETLMTSKDHKEIVTIDGFKTLTDESTSDVAIFWDNSVMALVIGKLSDYHFDTPEVMERYGLQELYNSSYDDVEATEVYDAPYLDDSVMIMDEVVGVPEPVMEITEADEDTDYKTVEEPEELIIEEPEEGIKTVEYVPEPPYIVEAPNAAYETTYDEDVYVPEPYDDSYNIAYNANYEIKKGLEHDWTRAHAMKILAQSADQSIVNNKSYTASLDKNAEATLWIGDFAKIYDNLMGGYYANPIFGVNFGSIYADSGMSAKLFTEKNELRLTTSYSMSESMAKSFEKMTDQKLNRKFLNYVNEDRMIGYMSYAVNTEAALKEYPKMLKNLYGNMPMYGEEAGLAVDLFELLLDEAAVAKVFPGDMLFLLSGISKKEVSYKTYEYNDNYEYEEVEQTKTETVPDFLMMISSEDQRLLKKLMDYGMKKEVITSKNDYYAIKIPESPLDIYVSFKNDIVFIGTSEDEITKIMADKFDSKLSSKHKKLLKNSNYSAYLSGKQLASKIPMDDLGVSDMRKLNWFLSNSEDAYITSSKMKGNTLQADMVIGVPASQENSLKYIFNMIETFAK